MNSLVLSCIILYNNSFLNTLSDRLKFLTSTGSLFQFLIQTLSTALSGNLFTELFTVTRPRVLPELTLNMFFISFTLDPNYTVLNTSITDSYLTFSVIVKILHFSNNKLKSILPFSLMRITCSSLSLFVSTPFPTLQLCNLPQYFFS